MIGAFVCLPVHLFAKAEAEPEEKHLSYTEVVCSSGDKKSLVLFDWAAHKFVKENTDKPIKGCRSSLRAWLTSYELDWMTLVGTEDGILSCLAKKNTGCAIWPPGIYYPERRRSVAPKLKKLKMGVVFEVSADDWKAQEKRGFTILLQDQNGWPLKNSRQLGSGMGLFLRWGEPLEAKPTQKRRRRKWVRVPLKMVKGNLFQLDRSVWLSLRSRLPVIEKNGMLWISRTEPQKD